MDILGLSFDYHDAAAALVRDGRVIAACQEERFSRKKNDPRFPHQAVRFCLEAAGIQADGLEKVVFYEDTALKFDRILASAAEPGRAGHLLHALDSWRQAGKFAVRERICEAIGIGPERVGAVRHHQAHAASAYFGSPFHAATIVTIDGVGEWETASVWVGEGNRISPLASLSFPQSLGLFYTAFTAYLGFEVNEGEYKVMGMAAFGQPAFLKEVGELITPTDDGFFRLDDRYFDFLDAKVPFSQAFVDRFGPPRLPESPFAVATAGSPPGLLEDPESRRFADLAASVQRRTEDILLHVVERAVARTGTKDVCMAGGVALNSLANGRIQRELGVRLHIHPAAGDAGGAVGAALAAYHELRPGAPWAPIEQVSLGPCFGPEATRAAAEASGFDSVRHFEAPEDLLDATVEALAGGQVVGWFQGRTEWGPRALGCRSILANPMLARMKQVVNEKVKFREPFRPFAPSVIEERAGEFFELPDDLPPGSPEHFMLSVCRVRPEKRADLPAVTHQDGTARVHVVRRSTNPLYHELIRRFGEATGVPVLLNTSFNLRGEPIVNSPEDALRTFSWSGLDLLALGSSLVPKEPVLCE